MIIKFTVTLKGAYLLGMLPAYADQYGVVKNPGKNAK
jgi:hypothetical protein